MTTLLGLSTICIDQTGYAVAKRVMVWIVVIARVLGRKLVAVAAMSPGFFGRRSRCAADGYASISTYTSQDVFSGRYSFDVSRVDATSNTANMVNVQSFRDQSYEDLVGQPMGRNAVTVHGKPGVSTLVAGQFPKPATGHRFRGNCIHKPLKYAESSHVISFGSLWSGLLGASNAVAARSYFTAFSTPARSF